jgi:predicted RNase H-like HicB family nuclease
MPKTPEEYLKEPYSRVLVPDEGGGYSAEMLEFPGCFAEGDTADEAMQALERAAQSWIQAALDQGQEIPEPYMNQGYGGRIALRLPKSLHRQAARLAERNGVSLNQFLVSTIAEGVGARDCFAWLKEKLKEQWSTHAQIIPTLAVNTVYIDIPSLGKVRFSQRMETFPRPSVLPQKTATTTAQKILNRNAWGDVEAIAHG